MRAEEAALLALLPPLTGCVVLDLACGSGRYSRIAIHQGARLVIGIDNSSHMLAEAAWLSARALGTTEAIPLAACSVDTVVCGLAVGHLPRLAPTLRECARVLRPGGAAMISDVHPFLFLNGAQRTFSSGGQILAVEHYVHLYSDFHQAAQAAGLRIDALLEPRALAEDAADAPAVPLTIIYRMMKD
jgi:SAM-dependent methyltransferase